MDEKMYLHTPFLDGDIMVSDSFVLSGEEYLLLSIKGDGSGKFFLRFLGITHGNLGKVYLVNKSDLEKHWKSPQLGDFIQQFLITK